MRDVPDIITQIRNAAYTRGGALLFSHEFDPVLTLPTFLGREEKRGPSISPNVRTVKKGKRVQTWADSAEAVRILKRAHGVPLRPTDEPVDVWGREAVTHG